MGTLKGRGRRGEGKRPGRKGVEGMMGGHWGHSWEEEGGGGESNGPRGRGGFGPMPAPLIPAPEPVTEATQCPKGPEDLGHMCP